MDTKMSEFARPKKILLLMNGHFSEGVVRFAVGLIFVPFLTLVLHRDVSYLGIISSLLIVLFLLRAVPAIVRRLIPFSPEIQTLWSERRQIAKRHDSYQWQKMLWLGAGLLMYSATSSSLSSGPGVIAASLLVVGSIALVRWSRLSCRVNQPPNLR